MTAPAAARQRTARASDLRLWLGILLLVGSTTAGYLLLSRGEDTVTVWRVTRDLAPGAAPTSLERVSVSRDVAGQGYARPGDVLTGAPALAGRGGRAAAPRGDRSRAAHGHAGGDGAGRPAPRAGGDAVR